MLAGINFEELRIVIVRRRSPHSRCMTRRAVVAQQQRNVVRICRLCILRCMTLVAIIVCKIVIVVHMTRNARRRYVSAREREVRAV